MTGDRGCALACVPPAQHCIFGLSAFRPPLTRVSQDTHDGYPHRFSPMRAFRQLPLPKADASQNGFHPAYALSCKMAWRNSFFYAAFKMRWRSLAAFSRVGWERRCRFPVDAHRIPRENRFVIKPLVKKNINHKLIDLTPDSWYCFSAVQERLLPVDPVNTSYAILFTSSRIRFFFT